MASDSNMDREMILADFQACTGIDNIAEAITLLELNNWDLVAAINGVIPQENGILQSPAFCPVQPSRHILERQSRMLNFHVEYRQRSIEVVLEDASTVGDIKTILETELQVPVSKMQLKGWKSGDVSDSTVLRSLHLPKNNSLYVLTPDIAPSASTSQSSPNRYLQMALVLVCAHAVALGSALASRYLSSAVVWHRLVGSQRPWGNVDEPRLVHR
ncbi:FAS-associated factor 1 [Labeo rohita]|uniref:FAS-associated factor 1 n=1 Tax=Labeo rohita TaxID=84645 RepID=A0A498NSU0_LABRO|nr:FAS-associated factor 1 [Labeo rohita]